MPGRRCCRIGTQGLLFQPLLEQLYLSAQKENLSLLLGEGLVQRGHHVLLKRHLTLQLN